MPSIPLYLPSPDRAADVTGARNPLPHLLKTPSGLALLEIQGTLNIPPVDASNSETLSTPIGRLSFPNYAGTDSAMGAEENLGWTKHVYLYVGPHQRLTGEVKKLLNPMAAVRRKQRSEAQESGGMESHGLELDGNDAAEEELEIVEIIRWKIIFSQRPEPISS